MIQLFKTPTVTEIPSFSNLLHDKIVDEFTEEFCDYVGGKYGCAVNSATNAIFLMGKYFKYKNYKVPAIIPPVVPNALSNSGVDFEFTDNTEWVGGEYELAENIWDSAQKVERNQCSKKKKGYFTIFSFYPTKPVGSFDGGMIVCDNPDAIELLKAASNNGMTQSKNSWERQYKFPGWKFYLNSIQAYVARESLKTLDERKEKLKIIRDRYNEEFGLNNTSDHLYRIKVKNNSKFVEYMKSEKIICGIHYTPCYKQSFFLDNIKSDLSQSAKVGKRTASLPFHPELTDKEIKKVIKCTKKFNSSNSGKKTERSAQ